MRLEAAVEETDSKLYDLKSKKIGDILYIEIIGKRTIGTVWAIAQRVVDLCKEQNIHRLFVDARKIKGLVSTSSVFSLGADRFEEIEWSSVIHKTAVVDNEEYAEKNRFFEDVAHNRGFRVRFFDSIIDALEWLNE